MDYFLSPPPEPVEGFGKLNGQKLEEQKEINSVREVYEQNLQHFFNFIKNDLSGSPYYLKFGFHPPTSIAQFNEVVKPKANDNKATIIMWMSYWPLSAIWFIVADMIKEMFNYIYDQLGGYFQRVSDEKFKNL